MKKISFTVVQLSKLVNQCIELELKQFTDWIVDNRKCFDCLGMALSEVEIKELLEDYKRDKDKMLIETAAKIVEECIHG